MVSDEKAVATPGEKETTTGQKRKTPDDAKITSFFKSGEKKNEESKAKPKEIEDNVEEDEDEEDEDEEDEDEEEEEEEDDSEEDMAPKKKKRRSHDSEDSDENDDESDPEIKMTEDDLVGVDTSNIIPRSRRRAAVAAMALASEEIAASTGVTPTVVNGDKEADDGESSDEAEF